MGAPPRLTRIWIQINIFMFSAYFLFGVLSLFWPSTLERVLLYPLHAGGLAYNALVLYGLLMKRRWSVYLVQFFSFSMVIHLLIFIFVPLAMSLAYIGPSRSFYAVFIYLVSLAGLGEMFSVINTTFNSFMALLHLVNLFFFMRKKTAEQFFFVTTRLKAQA
jgi:hypothetical protein